MSISSAAKLYAATVHQTQTGRVLDGTNGNDQKNLYDVLADVDQVGHMGDSNDVFVFNHGRSKDANIDAVIDMGDGEDTVKLAYAESDYLREDHSDGTTTFTYIKSRDGDDVEYGAKVTFQNAESFQFEQGEVPAEFVDGNFVGTDRRDAIFSASMAKDADGTVDMGGGNDRFKISAKTTDTGTYEVDMGEGRDVVALKHTIEDYKIKILEDGRVSFTTILADGNLGQTFEFENAESFHFYNVDLQTSENYKNDYFSIEELQELSSVDVIAAEVMGDAFQGLADGLGVDPTLFDADGDLTAKINFENEIA